CVRGWDREQRRGCFAGLGVGAPGLLRPKTSGVSKTSDVWATRPTRPKAQPAWRTPGTGSPVIIMQPSRRKNSVEQGSPSN
ncbi:MAG: hypothetical protein JXA78_15855, partial [Anaerolineales bacterium]|nr:hypothetical protein [Anaerolineales bacterium]